MNPTTKRFPRTTLEAWPNRHPYCVEHHRRLSSIGWEIAGVLVTVAVRWGVQAVAWAYLLRVALIGPWGAVLACRELGIPVDLTCPSLSERHLWREAFLTNSIRQIQSLDRICCVQTNVLGLEPWEVAFDRADGARPRQTLTGMISGMIRTDSTRE